MKFENGEIKLDFHDDVLSGLTAEQKKELALALVWDDDVINEFVDKITTEYVGSHYNVNLYKARLRLIDQMPEATRSLVRALMFERDCANKNERRHSDWAWKMFHAWPKGCENSRPELAKYESADFATDAEVEAVITDVAHGLALKQGE